MNSPASPGRTQQQIGNLAYWIFQEMKGVDFTYDELVHLGHCVFSKVDISQIQPTASTKAVGTGVMAKLFKLSQALDKHFPLAAAPAPTAPAPAPTAPAPAPITAPSPAPMAHPIAAHLATNGHGSPKPSKFAIPTPPAGVTAEPSIVTAADEAAAAAVAPVPTPEASHG